MSNASIALALLGGSTSSTSTMSALTAFRSYTNDQTAARRAFADSAAVTAAIDDFKSAAKKIETVDDLLGDRKTLTFVLSAFGLESDIDNVGKLRAVLESDPDDVNSYANRLTDARYGELAAFFDTTDVGMARLRGSEKQSELIDRYLSNEFEKSIGEKNEAARDALFFLRRINEVESAYDILSDLSLRSIVTDALNLPAQIANQSVEKQAALIESGIDLEAFQTSGAAAGSTTRLEKLTADLETIGEASDALASAQTVVDTLVAKLESLRTLYADYANIVDPDGVHADEIPIQEAAITDLLEQRGLVAAANDAVTDTRSALTELKSLYGKIQSAEDADELAELQASFLEIADRILGDDGLVNSAVYVDPNTGETRNLLRNGTAGALPDGIDAAEPQLSTVVASDGTRVVTNSTDLAGFLSELQGVRDAVAAANFDTLDADLDGVAAAFSAAETQFRSAELLTQINVASINNALGSVDFAVELNTDALALGFESATDALERAETIEEVLYTIKALAGDAQAEGADLEEINANYVARVAQLQSLVGNAGTVGDGSTTVALDNLLTSGTTVYSVRDGTAIRVEGADLSNGLLAGLPTSITVENAEQLANDVDQIYRPLVEETIDDLTRDRKVLDFAYSTLDPRGTLDAQVRKIQADLETLIEDAESDGTNLLSPYENDFRLVLDSLGSTITIEAQNGFKDELRAALEAFNTKVLSAGGIDERVSALNDVLFTVGRVQSRLQAEAYALKVQETIVAEEKAAIEGAGGDASSFLEPVEYTDAALKFIERYLVQKDLEASGVSVGSTDAQTSLASQIASILPSANSSINLSLLI